LKKIILISFFFVFINFLAYSQIDTLENEQVFVAEQEIDTVKKEKKHSPKLATYMSVALPGLGQAYNRQYYKVPIIYGGFGVFSYFFLKNNTYYKEAKEAYTLLHEDSTGLLQLELHGYLLSNPDDAKLMKDEYRKSRDLMAIGVIVLYVLNIIDASVYAHFYNFDITDDLSIRMEPVILKTISSHQTVGLKLNVYF